MMVPISISVIAMEIFGFEKGSAPDLAFERITVGCFAVALLFFMAAGILVVVRVFQALKDFMLSLRDWWSSRG
jgi:hypothetical protein